MENKIRDIFAGKKILILGLAREGLSSYKFIRKFFPDVEISLADKRGPNELDPGFSDIRENDLKVKFYSGDDYLKILDNFDLVVKTPGIPNKLPEIKDAKNKGVRFITQTEIFLLLFREKIIGITGTKGKSTTSSLINHILSTNGINSKLLGNIGKPVLDSVEGSEEVKYFVFEMSSHQLSDVTSSPHLALFLNIFPEHLDYYEDFKDYLSAKENITKFQTDKDIFIYNSVFSEIKDIAIRTKAKTIDINSVKVNISGGKLKGQHNLLNIKAAIAAVEHTGLKEKEIIKSVLTFEPLEGRLESVGEVNGREFVNDTLSTIPQAAMAAVESFAGKDITLILGGYDRGIDFEQLGKFIAGNDKIKNIILVGQTAGKIKEALKKFGYKYGLHELGTASMDKIVKNAYEISKPGSVILMSPASTSFDMFKDYKDRGDRFSEAVKNLAK